MGEKTHLDLEKICDKCGNVGFEEQLATCSKCGIYQEHIYCMRVSFKDAIEDWICEACISCADITSPVSPGCGRKEYSQNCSDAFRHESHALIQGGSSKISDDLQGSHHSERQHVVTTGKVKFLTSEEVVKLSAGATKKDSPSKSNLRYRTSCSSVTQKISPTRVPPPPRIIPSCLIKPTGHGRMQISSTTNNQQSPSTPKGKNSCPVAVAINSDVQERDLLNNLPKLRLYHPHFPALHVTWKGGFKFDAATRGIFYGGFQAQLPCRVHRKAYESSRKIPLILQVKLLPQCDILADLFKDICPDFRDIALYFFPSANIERSKENHATLFQLLEAENAAMSSLIDGIELLVFTSKQLHVDSQDIIARSGMENFLWGVFCHAKHDKIICKEFPSLLSPLGSECDEHVNTNSDEAVDMEIDMVGGTAVGRIDVAVLKESSRRFYVESNKETVDEDALKLKILYAFKDLDSTVEHAISKSEQAHHLVAKKISVDMASVDLLQSCLGKSSDAMDDADIPPGLGKSSKLKFSNILQENAVEKVNGDGDRYLKSYPMEVKTELQNSDYCDQDFSPALSTKSPREDALVSQLPSPDDGVRLNVVGVSKGNPGVAGAAGIISDESGNWILGFTLNLGKRRCFMSSELWAIFEGLMLAWEGGIRKVLVESDSRVAVESLKRAPNAFDPNTDLINCCINLIKRKWDCKVEHTDREANIAAKGLATHFDEHPLGVTLYQQPAS